MNLSPGKASGLLALAVSVVCCAASQLLLKFGMTGLGELPTLGSLPAYAFQLIKLPIVGGLALYAVGTGLWLMCLTRLDLSVAYPASAVQFLLIFAGAWSFFDEPVTTSRLVGAVIVLIGVLLLTVDRKAASASSATSS